MADSANIGTIFIGMRVGTAGLTKGLASASSKLASFSGAAIGSAAKGAAILGAAVGTAAVGLNALRASSSDAIDNNAKLSDRLGTTTENLIGLQHAAGLAGVDNEGLDKALTKLGVNLAKAEIAGKGTEGAFARLGISAGELAKMDRVDAFKMISGRIAAIPNQAEQAALAVELFGKTGAELGPLMMGGLDGINAGMAEAKVLGLSYTREQAASVEIANDAWGKIGEAIGGVGNTLAIALAPALAVVSEAMAAAIAQFNLWTTTSGDGSDFVIGALSMVGRAFGLVSDVIQTMQLGFMAAQSLITTGLGYLVQGIGRVAHAFEALINMIPGVKVEVSGFFESMSQGLKDAGSDQWAKFQAELAKPPPSEGVQAFFDGLKVKAMEAKAAAAAVPTSGKDWSAQAEILSDKEVSAGQSRQKFAGALEMGSTEARSSLLAWQNQSGDATSRTARATEATAGTAAAMLMALQALPQNLKNALNQPSAQRMVI
jgi:hypothetical protein